MKKYLLAAGAALALGGSANAATECDRLCGFGHAPAAPVATAVAAPAPVAAPARTGVEDSVGLVNMGKAAVAQVTLGAETVTMQIDTGASDRLVTEGLAKALTANGEADWTTCDVPDSRRAK